MHTDDDARRAFGHLFDPIFECVTEGVRDYYRDHPHVNHKHRPGTRKNVVRDYIVYRLRAALSGVTSVHVFEKNGTVNFGMNSEFLGRVNALGESFAAALGHTNASLAFQENNPAGAGLGAGFEAATCIRLGYLPLPAVPMEPRVFITCPHGRQNAWFIELRRAEGAMVVPGPMPPPDDFEDLVEVIPDPMRKGDAE
ncbi:hypothetical protein LPC08_12270 [Roseomonas sp. OT10]|uniref:hypothetical protein n=1 Tax=Roseomonas cutis TaxID=2897332 RepID=UPI001E46CF15|nr:hypothetical protein [Roseomonas sp. OT10]UFN46808.1 hypothetical protein LPC08_12270 [Roseomonas sp. OT10]